MWWGAGAGIVVSIIFGAIFAGVYYAAKTLLFKGTAKAIFQVQLCAWLRVESDSWFRV